MQLEKIFELKCSRRKSREKESTSDTRSRTKMNPFGEMPRDVARKNPFWYGWGSAVGYSLTFLLVHSGTAALSGGCAHVVDNFNPWRVRRIGRGPWRLLEWWSVARGSSCTKRIVSNVHGCGVSRWILLFRFRRVVSVELVSGRKKKCFFHRWHPPPPSNPLYSSTPTI